MNPPNSPTSPSTEAQFDSARTLPGARAGLILLLSINLLNYVDRYILAAVIPDLRQEFLVTSTGDLSERLGPALSHLFAAFQKLFGFTPNNALLGLLSMAFMVLYMVAAPVFGRLAERRSRWKLIAVGVALWSFASGASGLAGTFLILLVTRCFVGIGEAAYGPVAPALISDFYPVAVRGRVLSWFYMAIPVGTAIGFAFGEQVAKSSLGWRWAFYLVVAPGLLLAFIATFMREPRLAQARAVESARRVGWADYLVLLRTRSYVLNTLGMTAMTFAMGGIGFWMVDYMKEMRKVPGDVATIFGAIMVVAGLVGTLTGGMAGDKLRRRFPGSYFLVSGVAMWAGFPFFLGVLYAPFPWAWLLMFLACVCLFFNTGPTNTVLANVTHPAIRAEAFALNIFVIHALGDVISPFVIGMISDRANMTAAFQVVGMMFLVSGAFWMWGARYLARDTALAATRLNA